MYGVESLFLMAGTITSIQFQKRTSDRVNIFLDGAYAFALPAVDAAALKKGQILDDDAIQALQQIDLRARAYDRALRFLARRPRSIWEVRQHLRKMGQATGRRTRTRRQTEPATESQPEMETVTASPVHLSELDTETVLERLSAQGYLDDRAFVQYWIDQRNRFKPMAPRALRYELRNKGVDEALIESMLQEEETTPEFAALQAARSRAERWAHLEQKIFQKKLIGFLNRRGFGWSVVKPVVDQMWQEIVDDAEDPST